MATSGSVPPEWVPPLPPRASTAHKGDLGRLLIIGASPGLTGAVALAAEAALRSGAGLVTCAVPEVLSGILEVKTTEAMTLPVPCGMRADGAPLAALSLAGLEVLTEAVNGADAVVVGPGLGREPQTTELLGELFPRLECPHLVDADGLWHLAQERSHLATGHRLRVLTPHEGEMAGLLAALTLSGEGRSERALALAECVPGVLVLKGPGTLVHCGADCITNTTGNAGMATAGSGDTLAGIIGAFLARGDTPVAAARRGVYLHGRAGDLAAASLGQESLIARDIVAHLPAAMRELTERDGA